MGIHSVSFYLVLIIALLCTVQGSVFEAKAADNVDFFLKDNPDENKALMFYDTAQESKNPEVVESVKKVVSVFLGDGEDGKSTEEWVKNLKDKVNLMRVSTADCKAAAEKFKVSKTPFIVLFDKEKPIFKEEVNENTFDNIKAVLDKPAEEPKKDEPKPEDKPKEADKPKEEPKPEDKPKEVEKPKEAEKPKDEDKDDDSNNSGKDVVDEAEEDLKKAKEMSDKAKKQVEEATKELNNAKKQMLEYSKVEDAKKKAEDAKKAADEALKKYEDAKKQMDDKIKEYDNAHKPKEEEKPKEEPKPEPAPIVYALPYMPHQSYYPQAYPHQYAYAPHVETVAPHHQATQSWPQHTAVHSSPVSQPAAHTVAKPAAHTVAKPTAHTNVKPVSQATSKPVQTKSTGTANVSSRPRTGTSY